MPSVHDFILGAFLVTALIVLVLAIVAAPFAMIVQHRAATRQKNIPPDRRVWKRTDWHPPTKEN